MGSRGQILIDLIGAGALLGLGLFQLTPAVAIGEENWAMQLMGKLPELGGVPLLALGAGCALVSPENLVFYVKEGGMLLTNHTSLWGDMEVGAVFVAITTSLLLLPPLLWLLSGERLRGPLTALNDWLVHRAEWLVGVLPCCWASIWAGRGWRACTTPCSADSPLPPLNCPVPGQPPRLTIPGSEMGNQRRAGLGNA